jgi:hypothetical protein
MEDQANLQRAASGGDADAAAAVPEAAPAGVQRSTASSEAGACQAVVQDATPEASPLALLRKPQRRLLRAAAPSRAPPQAAQHEECTPQEEECQVLECCSPLSCSSAEGDESEEDGEVLPVALEAALNAVVEEADAQWTAAVSAAMTAAQDDDGEAWHVAMEAALEVATARAASAGATLLRDKMPPRQTQPPPAEEGEAHAREPGHTGQASPLPTDGAGDVASARQSPPDPENAGPQEALPPACIPRGAKPSPRLQSAGAGEAAHGVADMLVASDDVSMIQKSDLSSDQLQYSPGQSPFLRQEPTGAPSTPAAGAGVPPGQVDTAWLTATHASSVAFHSPEAGEAACRSIEAEIIRRCIPEKSPTEYRLVRTPTDRGKVHGSSAGAVVPRGGARRVACATPGEGDESPRAGKEEGQSPGSGARAAEENDAMSKEDAGPVLRREARKAVRSAPPPPPSVLAACTDEENNPVVKREERKVVRKAPPPQPAKAGGAPLAREHAEHHDAAPPPARLDVVSEGRKSNTYTEADLQDLAIAPARSPSESVNHHGASDPMYASSPSPSAPAPHNVPHAEMTHAFGALVTFDGSTPAGNIRKPSPSKVQSSRAAPSKPQPGLDFWNSSWFGAFSAASATNKTPSSSSSPSPAAALAPHSILGHGAGTSAPERAAAQTLQPPAPAGGSGHMADQSPKVPSLLPTVVAQMKQIPTAGIRGAGASQEGFEECVEEARACGALPPLQGQLYLDGEELIVPDPALGLLNCPCERTVAVCHPAEIPGSSAFVDVCIDCGQVHHRANSQ